MHLSGRIYYRLNLSEPSRHAPISRKRKRTTIDSSHCTGAESGKVAFLDVDNLQSQQLPCGFVFVPNHGHGRTHSQYLMSIPKKLVKLACDAVLSKQEVAVVKFKELSLMKDADLPTSSSLTWALLEVHRDGLEILPTHRDQTRDKESAGDCKAPLDAWTLTQWWRKEIVDSTRLKKSRLVWDIVATVDGISPIISLDPRNPFALVEVYDEANTDVTSVIVMRGEKALASHAAIQPLDTVVFKRLVYKAWSVPSIIKEEANFLSERVPSHVFLATESFCVSWDHPSHREQRQGHRSCFSNQFSAIPPVITPVNLIPRIQGTIQHVQIANTSTDLGTVASIQYVDMDLLLYRECDSDHRPNCCRLYVAHFPMSTALQLSLRKGADIEASNVHLVLKMTASCAPYLMVTGESSPGLIYGACLRSTLTVTRFASDDACTFENHQVNQTQSETDREYSTAGLLCGSLFLQQGYSFPRIKEGYLQMIYRDHIKGWARQNFRASVHMIPMSWVLESLCDHASSGDNDAASRRKHASRNPYAEFFDHPFSLSVFETTLRKDLRGCTLSSDDSCGQYSSSACLIGLDEIRQSSQSYTIRRIRERLECRTADPIKSGWSGTVLAGPRELFLGRASSVDHPKKVGSCADFFVGGCVSELGSFSRSGKVVQICDDACQIPVNALVEKMENFEIDDFVLGRIEIVSVACLCLGFAAKSSGVHDIADNDKVDHRGKFVAASVSLPSLSEGRKDLLGGCFLITVGGFLFIGCMHVHCRTFFARKETALPPDQNDGCFSIEQCLGKQSDGQSQLEGETAQGLLTRSFFRKKLQKDGTQQCCELVVASVPETERNEDSLGTFCLQSIGVSVCLSQNTAMILKLTETLNQVWPGESISDAQKMTAASFWSLGDSGKSCALTIGGTEDLVSGSLFTGLRIFVEFFLSDVERTALGVVRVRSQRSRIAVYLRNNDDETPKTDAVTFSRQPPFDFETASKPQRGLLYKRLDRRNLFKTDCIGERVIGDLLAPPSATIPRACLSELFERMCAHLRQGDEGNLYSSLVQRVANASLLGISFCQVLACCTNCCSALIDENEGVETNARALSLERLEEPSFWHLPHPRDFKNADPPLLRGKAKGVEISSLRCPKRCPLHFYRAKWECSGVVDDGTGQATIYADGDAALTLLGMSKETIQWIERGLWHVPGGSLTFKKSIPPSKRLRSATQNILIKKASTAEQSRLLSLPLRAEYLLQMHCRSSTSPRRPLDYYIRCKPLPDKNRHLHHTSVDSFFVGDGGLDVSIFHGEASSYTLPALKLELVDCATPADDVYLSGKS